MAESSFLNLVRGNRLNMYMGLTMDEGVAYRFPQDYTYVEIPLRGLYNPGDKEMTNKGLRNQLLQVVPACQLNIKGGYRVLVKTNPALQEYGSAPQMFLLDNNEGEQPVFHVALRKDMDPSSLNWAVRLYMIA